MARPIRTKHCRSFLNGHVTKKIAFQTHWCVLRLSDQATPRVPPEVLELLQERCVDARAADDIEAFVRGDFGKGPHERVF
jgi:hypothetical protein